MNSQGWRVPEAALPWSTGHVRCTPDSPVNYSGAPLEIPEGGQFELESSGAPDTVRRATGQSGAPDQGGFLDALKCGGWGVFIAERELSLHLVPN